MLLCQKEKKRKEQSVTLREEAGDGRASVTTSEERVLLSV